MGRYRRVLGGLVAAVVLVALALPAGASAACSGVPKPQLPAAVPQRLHADEEGQDDPDGPAGELLALRPLPKNKAGVATQPDRVEPQRRLLARASRSSSTSRGSRRRATSAVEDRAGQRPRAVHARHQPLLLLDEKTGKRQIVWGELDAPTASRPRRRNLIVHPAKNLVPGRRYVVVLRNLRRHGAGGLRAGPGQGLVKALSKAKVNTRERLPRLGLHGRLGQVADRAPARHPRRRLQAARRHDPGRRQDPGPRAELHGHQGRGLHARPGRADRAQGHRHVRRSVLPRPAGLPAGLALPLLEHEEGRAADPDAGQRRRREVLSATSRASRRARPSHIALYGHGLLGSHTQIDEDNIQDMSAEHDFTFCATDWQGMEENDVPQRGTDPQGLLELPRAGRPPPAGVAEHAVPRPAARPPAGPRSPTRPSRAPAGRRCSTRRTCTSTPTRRARSSAGTTAFAPDWTRAVLGVATMNYSLLLPRSVDFDTYAFFSPRATPTRATAWRSSRSPRCCGTEARPNGWAYHVTSKPPKNTIKHTC